MDPLVVLVEWLVVGAGTLGASLVVSREARAKRALRRAKRVAIAQAPHGRLVKVVGRLRLAGPPLAGPLTGRACAYYALWPTLEVSAAIPPCEERGQDFLLDDDTGTALVRFERAEVVAGRDGRWVQPEGSDPRLLTLMQRYAVVSGGGVSPLSFREGVLEPGEVVTVCGLASWEPDPRGASAPQFAGANYRDAGRILVLRAPARAKMLVSDDPSVK